MAKRHDPGTYTNRTVSRRSKRKSTGKTLPGSEAVWDKGDLNLSYVEKTQLNVEHKFLGPAFVNRSRRKSFYKHKSDKDAMMPVTDITTDVLFNARQGKSPIRPLGVERFDKIRDIGPGNSVRGVSDNKENSIYADQYKIYETLYGRRLKKTNVSKKRP